MRKRGVVAGAIGLTVITAAALRGVLRRFEIEEASMSPALDPGAQDATGSAPPQLGLPGAPM